MIQHRTRKNDTKMFVTAVHDNKRRVEECGWYLEREKYSQIAHLYTKPNMLCHNDVHKIGTYPCIFGNIAVDEGVYIWNEV